MCSVSVGAKSRASGTLHVVMCVAVVIYLLISTALASAAKKTIPYCIDPNWLPYEAIQNNQHIGISSEYMAHLQQNTAYTFELVKTKSWQQTLNYLQNGRCWLVPMLNQTPERQQFLDFTAAYFTSQNVLVSLQDQPFMQSFESIGDRTLGVTQGYRIAEYIEEHHPQINMRTYQNEKQGLKAVSAGQVDLFLGSLLSVNNHITALGLSNLKIAGWGGPEDVLRMGVIKNQPVLLADINTALTAITGQQHLDAYNNWSGVSVIDNTNYRLIWQVLLGALVVLALMLARFLFVQGYNKQLQQKNQQLRALQDQLEQSNAELKNLSQQDALTKLYNRHYINQLIKQQAITYEQHHPMCLIILDLDHFKHINDQHGHTIGDDVLQEFAHIIKMACTADELVARWGGEEFIILKKQAHLEQAELLCQTIQQRIRNQIFSHREQLTCSFGVAQIQPGESLMACFDRADAMLYQAKHEGRDRICLAG